MKQLVPEVLVVAESSLWREQRTGFTLDMEMVDVARHDVVIEGVQRLCCAAAPSCRSAVERRHCLCSAKRGGQGPVRDHTLLSRRAGWAAPALAKLQGAAMSSVRLPCLYEMAECVSVSTFKL